ncbi:MAG: DUF5688 family protein [Bacteroidales bacterium]|nr:DUF5688 family protein [Clostridium sp.]MCM1203948.1 DUF5688 family protein [Bacteroidales bacterium]
MMKKENYAMNYQEFLEYIKDNLPECLVQRMAEAGKEADGYEVLLHQVTKNNGIVLDGITIQKKGDKLSPNIYLNSYFESYQMGKPISVIMEEIIYRYTEVRRENIEIADILDFKAVKDRIVLRLVNYEKNQNQLKHCPHKRFLDLAVTFRYIASRDMLGIASLLVTNHEFEAWEIGLDELYQLALFNTMRDFPWKLDSLEKVICDCLKSGLPQTLPEEIVKELKQAEDKKERVNMFVLSNDSGLNGATSMLYDEVIQNFSRVHACNVFILPSSVHEVMLVPENEGTDAGFLQELVIEANRSAVGLIDLLSDNIYYYDGKQNRIYIYGQN